MSFGLRDFTNGPFKKKKGQFFERYGMEKHFDVGDVVQFNNVYKWCDGATEGIDYRVVEDAESKKWKLAQEVNGYTREITVSCVNTYHNDFMLMAKAPPKLPELPTQPGPINVNIQVQAGDDIADGYVPMNIQKLMMEAISKHVPGGTLFRGGLVPKKEPGLIGEAGAESIIPTKRDPHTGMLHTGKTREELGIPAAPDNITELEGVLAARLSMKQPFKVELKDGNGVVRMRAGSLDSDAGKIVGTEIPKGPIKSDGGSSSYYDLPIPNELMEKLFDRWEEGGSSYLKTEEMIRYFFGNDFDFGTALKSLVRAYGTTQGGGKAGNDVVYETNKVQYYAKKIGEIHG